ncbi:hypothetical protein [Epilithonimonas zeae]|uniref:hypothetical protein n=1 Tax=Epilithonimonas zeae TaxID=1416779 RepID=UPI00200CDE19|nr:hypothetical protein [Epilithonimonas zeae]UQB69999.1 hypothetical protein KI430_06110 [Epilithonimonas zeae]
MKNIFLLFSIFINLNFLLAQKDISYQIVKNDNLELISRKAILYKDDSIRVLPKKYFESKYLNKKDNQIVIIINSVIDIDKIEDWKYGTNLFKIENVDIQSNKISKHKKRESVSFYDKNGNLFIFYTSSPNLPMKINIDFLKSNLDGSLFNHSSDQIFIYVIQEIKRINKNEYILKIFQSPNGYSVEKVIRQSENSNYIMYLNPSSEDIVIQKIEKI